jgi:hypothetical protein
MNTFLPSADFRKSAECLDYKRCGKQRVEAYQILDIVSGKRTTGGWINHPAVLMWVGYPEALRLYLKCFIEEWVNRGYNNNMEIPIIGKEEEKEIEMPHWLGDDRLHTSHRSNLLRKDPEYYKQFGWTEGPFLEYYWPSGKQISASKLTILPSENVYDVQE